MRARRVRRTKLLLFVPCAVAFALLGFILNDVGMLASESNQYIFIIFFGVCSLAFMLWNYKVPCPRCGWNINQRKPEVLLHATSVPSLCPNCSLDLERVYVAERYTVALDPAGALDGEQ